MWKILVAFIVFAALSIFVIMKGGSNLDMGGEKHGTETVEPHGAASGAAPAASAASAASQ